MICIAMASEDEVHGDVRDLESNNRWETICWGCKLQLTLARFEPIFKCGYCGAVTVHETTTSKQRLRWSVRCSSILDHFLVTLVFIIVTCIIYGGVWTVFPILFPSRSFSFFFHSAVTVLLAFNTMFNFLFAAFIRAGPVPPVEWGQVEVVNRGGLENYKFCSHCQKPKHPAAHHCRTCRACVMEMDHHCPFIGNCVGANNHGYFILFLVFTLVSCLYVLGMVIYTYKYSTLMSFEDDPPESESGASALDLSHFSGVLAPVLFDDETAVTIRQIGLIYLFIISLALLIGISLLLYQQLALVYRGQTFLDSLSAWNDVNAGSSRKKGFANLQRVLGNRYPWLWLVPCVSAKKFHAR